MNTDIIIIGGGISGLHTAYQLQKSGIDFILVEARERLGGRILSNNYKVSTQTPNTDIEAEYDAAFPAFDLGPSWFWPGQKNIEALIHELNLSNSIFSQQGSGESVYEDQQGNIQKGFYGISMESAFRLNGGIRQIIAKLEDQIDAGKIIKSARVESIEYKDNEVITTFYDDAKIQDKPHKITSKKVVMALPPRMAMSSIEFQPPLTTSRVRELNSYATWMAGHAKVLAVYAKPFWLEQGLSGDAVSHLGPLREIHDASSHPSNADRNSGYALFGFVGIPGRYRVGNEDQICSAAIEQLTRLFGDEAANSINVVLQDWAQEEFTATDIDQSMNGGHASSSISNYTESSFDDCLIWSGTETADHRQGFNGLLEGALEASIRTLTLLR